MSAFFCVCCVCYFCKAHHTLNYVYCNMKIWFRWSVVIVILVSFALLCTRFVSYFILPFAEHSTHLVTIYKVFKFNFFTCSTQNDIFLMLLSFPQQTLFDVPQFLLLLRLLLNLCGFHVFFPCLEPSCYAPFG